MDCLVCSSDAIPVFCIHEYSGLACAGEISGRRRLADLICFAAAKRKQALWRTNTKINCAGLQFSAAFDDCLCCSLSVGLVLLVGPSE